MYPYQWPHRGQTKYEEYMDHAQLMQHRTSWSNESRNNDLDYPKDWSIQNRSYHRKCAYDEGQANQAPGRDA